MFGLLSKDIIHYFIKPHTIIKWLWKYETFVGIILLHILEYFLLTQHLSIT